MAETIPRKLDDSDALSYAALRKDGIHYAQELSGSLWTDFNAHDPGVTILEQLCFGLSELAYRSNFPVEDLLTSPDGTIDFSGLGLYLPEEILPCAPVTKADFCKYLFTKLPFLDDVSIPEISHGLHHVFVRPYLPLDSKFAANLDRETVRRDIAKAWYESRNICEDLAEITIRKEIRCYLDAEIEISGRAFPEEVLAGIYFKCARLIASDIQTERYDSLIAKGESLEKIFTGPLCPAGWYNENGFRDKDEIPSDVRLMSEVKQVQGVHQIRRMRLVDADGKAFRGDCLHPFLAFPETPNAFPCVTLTQNDHAIPFTPDLYSKTIRVLRKLEFEYRAFRSGSKMREQLPPLPEGQYRDFSQYSSVCDHFPDVYGVGPMGLSSRVPKEYQQGAQQLKDYLKGPEQLLADGFETLSKFPEFVSIKQASPTTYFSTSANSTNLLSRMDGVLDRKHRILNQSLAMYGVEFPQELWNSIHGDTSQSQVWMLECKRKYLEELRSLSYGRSQIQYWVRRIELLLGFSAEQVPEVMEPILFRKRTLKWDERTPSLANWLVLCWKKDGIPKHICPQVEAFVRTQVPAHVLSLHIWLNESECSELSRIYIPWKEAFKKYCAMEMDSAVLDPISQQMLAWLERSWSKSSPLEGF